MRRQTHREPGGKTKKAKTMDGEARKNSHAVAHRRYAVVDDFIWL